MLLSYIYFVVFLYVLFGRKKNEKRPAHGLSKSLPFFARATSCEHSVERRLSLVSAVPISGTKELASRTPSIVWHTRSDTFVLVPLLELTRAVAQTVPVFFLILPFVGGLLYKLTRPKICLHYLIKILVSFLAGHARQGKCFLLSYYRLSSR
jgi:hypothetical protein